MTLLNTHTDPRLLRRTLLERLSNAAPTESGRPGSAISLRYADDFERGYASALIDLLVHIDALTVDPITADLDVTSVQAGYLLRLLADLLDSDTPLVADWSREGVSAPADQHHPFARGVDLLAALEQRRLELLPSAVPLREVRAAVGLIMRHDQDGAPSYLLAYDADAGTWQLLGGRFELRDASLRDTLLRELAEELDCACLTASDVSLTERGPLFAIERLSPTYGMLTRTTFQVYTVHFTHGPPKLHAGLRWISEAEVLAGITADQQRVAAEPLLHLRDRLGLALDTLVSA
jgi:8-oxo-dGTP pyrophosphatase MutT (NUDIX family)